MAYKYYLEVELGSHLLYANEVAEILYTYGLKSKSGEPATKLVTALLSWLDEQDSRPRTFYPARNGLRRVYYSSQRLVQEAMAGKAFFQKNTEDDEIHSVKIGDKNYRYQFSRKD